MRSILLIGTGGTIASEVTDSGLAPELTTEQLLAQLPAILSVAVLLVSPVSGSYRYAMPMIFMLPLLIGLRLLPEPPPQASAGGEGEPGSA